MNHRCSLALLLACTLTTGIASAERRDHDAHVHGVAAMDVAALEDSVEIVLRSPAMNLVGFEHEPRDDDERERVRAAREWLDDGASLFTFEGAECRLAEAWSRWHHAREGHAHGHDTDHDHGGEHGHDEDHGHGEAHHGHDHGEGHGHEAGMGEGHSEIHAHYRFDCDNAPSVMETALFERFPRTGEIRVQFITDSVQGGRVLKPASSTLVLE